jgi:hypothetical protein
MFYSIAFLLQHAFGIFKHPPSFIRKKRNSTPGCFKNISLSLAFWGAAAAFKTGIFFILNAYVRYGNGKGS